MPKIDKIAIEIETGERGHSGPVQLEFNGHALTFETLSGSTQSGASYSGEFEVGSFGHSVVLVGPDTGHWDITKLRVSYHFDGEESYHLQFAPMSLDETTSLNIYRSRPRPSFDI